MSPDRPSGSSHGAYNALLLAIAGIGGALYGYDIGIIGAALGYLTKTISLTVSQESLVVAAVLAGGPSLQSWPAPLRTGSAGNA